MFLHLKHTVSPECPTPHLVPLLFLVELYLSLIRLQIHTPFISGPHICLSCNQFFNQVLHC